MAPKSVRARDDAIPAVTTGREGRVSSSFGPTGGCEQSGGPEGLGWRRDTRAAPARPARGHLSPLCRAPAIKRAPRPGITQFAALSSVTVTPSSSSSSSCRFILFVVVFVRRNPNSMASNYVDTTGEEGRFHGPHHHHHHSASTTPTGAAASSPRTMRRSFSSASSTGGHSHGSGGGKCVCAPPTHAGSFKCRLHRTNSQGHGHPHPSPPTSPAGGASGNAPAPSAASSRTVEAQ